MASEKNPGIKTVSVVWSQLFVKDKEPKKIYWGANSLR